ncbi:Trk system potassium transport protein TrkA [Tyzzerella sp. An114]|uniref:Trk system potassium transporter TrkA n=1 Tax=Tyzzerella sp. An114 TaxID=1965545 RepID=UPI000B443A81|nr:Trk system potassium transporter TrkA [Tyzzerella sp. An114]OUQ59120.1 Trk system potassium transport protein TrkA [Tyzzerella sp. An114]
MKIVVVGCGKVGYALTEQLTEEGHEITLIDTKEERIQSVLSQLDVQAVCGNGTSYVVQRDAGVEDADLLIAVTNQDEINLLSCLIAKKAGNCHTIARVRDPEYYREIGFIKEELGLAMAINPEKTAAAEISDLIRIPSAMEIDKFARGKVNLIKFKIPEKSILNNMVLSEYSNTIGKNTLVCIVKRNSEIIIPDGNFVLSSGDIISIIIPPEYMSSFFQKIGIKMRPIKNVMIAGGSTIAYYLASSLIQSKIKVKIIESDRKKCDILSEMLPEAMIIYGDAADKTLLLEEGIKRTDAFVSLTNMDEENILLSLYANKISDAKLITKINKIDFGEVISDIPVGSIICPKFITAEHIIQYVRSLKNSFGSNVEALYRLMDNKVEALEFSVKKDSKVTNVPFSNLNIRSGIIVCCINRQGKIITPSGKDMILKGDTVIIVTTELGLNDIKDILED